MAKMLILVVLAFLSFLGTFCPSITVAASLVPAFDGAIDSGLLSPAQLSAVQKSPSQDGNDTENLKELAAIGCCYSYLGFFLTDWYEDWNRDKMNAACKIYCATQELSDGYGCLAPINITLTSELDMTTVYTDDDGLHWTAGLCECELEIAEDLIEIIAEGFSKLSSVICSVFASIFADVLEVGVMFLPGADILDAVDDIISTVKTFDQNVLSPLDYFNNFLGNKCGIQGITLDPIGLFGIIAAGSSSLGTSKGCKRKNPLACATPKDNDKPAPDTPRSPEKDPWEGETPPTNDIPGYCDNSASSSARDILLGKRKPKCAPIPSIEGNGYKYEDKAATNPQLYSPNTWSVQCPDKWSKGMMNDAAVLHLQPEHGMLTVEYAYLDTIDTIKTLKLRDMIAGMWRDKTGLGVESINTVVHQQCVNKVWAGRSATDRGVRGKVLDLLGKTEGDSYSVAVTDKGNARTAFDTILKETPQASGVYKMLETYAGGQGRQITRFDITRAGGQDSMWITIGQGATP